MASIKDEPFNECPRYSKCNVNNCPLCTGYPDMYVDPEDKEQKCNLAKSIRVRIAANYPGMLQYAGMTPREYQARKRWESLSPEEQEAIKERGKKPLHSYSDSGRDTQTIQTT